MIAVQEKGYKDILEELEEGKIKKTKTIAHVDYYIISKNAYSFHFYAVFERKDKKVLTEMLYDLRNKKYYIKRNGRVLRFNIDNLDSVIPRSRDGYGGYNSFSKKEYITDFLDMISVEENEGMYETMLTAIGSMGGEKVEMTSRALIRLIEDYHKLELLYKAGLDVTEIGWNFSHAVTRAGNRNVSKIPEIFGLSKSQYKFAKEVFKSGNEIAENMNNLSLLDHNDINMYRSHVKHIKELEEKYNVQGRLASFNRSYRGGRLSFFLSATRRKKKGTDSWDQTFYDFILKNGHSNPMKLLEYLLFECYLSQGLEYDRAMMLYMDYYRMCMDMNYERFEKYPKYLSTFHDIVAMNYQVVLDEVKNREFAKETEKYKDLEMTLGEFCTVIPERTNDLIIEGNSLQHCVGSYVTQVIEGRTMIVFLRDRDFKEDPMVTMEVRDGRIVQVNGFAHRPPNNKEKAAISKFAKRKELKVIAF